MGENAPRGAEERPFPTEKGFRQTNSQARQSEKHISLHQHQSSSCNGSFAGCNMLASHGRERDHIHMHAHMEQCFVTGGRA